MTSPSGGGGAAGCDKQEDAALPVPVEELCSALMTAAGSETQPGNAKVTDTLAVGHKMYTLDHRLHIYKRNVDLRGCFTQDIEHTHFHFKRPLDRMCTIPHSSINIYNDISQKICLLGLVQNKSYISIKHCSSPL